MTSKVIPKDLHWAGVEGAIPRTMRTRIAALRPKTPEATTQDMAEQYCRWVGVAHVHLPPFLLAAAFRRRTMGGAEQGAARDAAERIRGLPDFCPLVYHGYFAFVELKTPAGKLTKEQRDWQAVLGTVVINGGIDAFKAFLDAWILLVDDVLRDPAAYSKLREFLNRKAYP